MRDHKAQSDKDSHTTLNKGSHQDWLSTLPAPMDGAITETGNYEDIRYGFLSSAEIYDKPRPEKMRAFVESGIRESGNGEPKDIAKEIPKGYFVLSSEPLTERGGYSWVENAYLLWQAAKSEATKIAFHIRVGDGFYLQMAKLAALRSLAGKFLPGREIMIAAQPAKYNKYPVDQYTNLIRASAEYTAALLSGADILLPADYLIDKRDESKRLSANMVDLLLHESKLGRSGNRWAGSTSLSDIAYKIGEKSWELLKKTEDMPVIECEKLFQKLCKEHREERIKNIGERRIIGVTEYFPQEQIIDVFFLGEEMETETGMNIHSHYSESFDSLISDYEQSAAELCFLASSSANERELMNLRDEMRKTDKIIGRKSNIFILDGAATRDNIAHSIIAGGFDD